MPIRSLVRLPSDPAQREVEGWRFVKNIPDFGSDTSEAEKEASWAAVAALQTLCEDDHGVGSGSSVPPTPGMIGLYTRGVPKKLPE